MLSSFSLCITSLHSCLLVCYCSADLLLVMLASRSAALYQEVKLASDAVLGLPSQVLVAAAAGVGSKAQPRGRLQYCANLGLKINAKMGGVNVRLAGNPDQVAWDCDHHDDHVGLCASAALCIQAGG